MAERPCININFGSKREKLIVSALVDTGAQISVLKTNIARKILTNSGRAYALQPTDERIRAASGESIKVHGRLEVHIEGIGKLNFLIADIIHDVIIGWDYLNKFGVILTENELTWGGMPFKYNNIRNIKNVEGEEIYLVENKRRSEKMSQFMEKFKKVFGEPDILLEAKVEPLKIKTTGGPVAQKPYRLPLTKLAIVDEEIDKMLKLGVIRPSASPYASPITLAPKPDGTTRFCIDFRRLNAITVNNKYPLPNIREIFDRLGGSKIYSTIDMKSGYWQIPLHKSAIEKTAFTCHRGLYEWLRLPFGLKNAPSQYMAIINKVLGKYIGKFCLVYLDDVIIYSKSVTDHHKHLNLIFEALQAANLTVKESKCHFFETEVKLLGYIINQHGLRAQTEKTSAILTQPAPTNIDELRRFLGLASYYRTLVPNFAELADPLCRLLRKDSVWCWNEEQNNAFNRIKVELCSERVIAYPDLNKPYIIHSDASDYAVGAVLSQIDETGMERPIQYLSGRLIGSQTKWSPIEKEAFALVYALKKFHCYVYGSEVTCYTDHKPLLSFFVGEIKNTKVQRWSILISEYGAKIAYKEGRRNIRADQFSRVRSAEPLDDKIVKDISSLNQEVITVEGLPKVLSHYTKGEISVIDASSEWLSFDDEEEIKFPPLPDQIDLTELKENQRKEFPEEYNLAVNKHDNFILLDDIICSDRRPYDSLADHPRILLPEKFRKEVIQRCHKESGHSGKFKTLARVQDAYVWNGMVSQIKGGGARWFRRKFFFRR